MKRILIALALLLPLCARAQYVTLTGTLQASNGLPAKNFSISFTPSQFGFIAGTGVLVNSTTSCATSTDGSVVGLQNPLQSSIITAAFVGTLPAGNYYVEYGWQQTGGTNVTLVSPESVVNLSATGQVLVPPPASGAPAGASFMNVYIGATSGSETYQGQIAAGSTYNQAVPLVSGSAVPSTNTTTCKQVANDVIWPFGTGYNVALVDSNGNTLPGYPMQWQLLGANTTINVSNGLPYYHGVVTFPTPILASPLNHATQSINGGLNLNGYPLTNVPNIFYLNQTAQQTSSGPLLSTAITPGTGTNYYADGGTIADGTSLNTVYNTLNSFTNGASAYAGALTTSPGWTLVEADGVSGTAVQNGGTTYAVGLRGNGLCLVTANCWGENTVVSDQPSVSAGSTLYGYEDDVNVYNTTTHGFGIDLIGFWTAQSVNMPAIDIRKPIQGGGCTTCAWTSGLQIDIGAVEPQAVAGAPPYGVGMFLNPVQNAASQNSQLIALASESSGAALQYVHLYEDPGANFEICTNNRFETGSTMCAGVDANENFSTPGNYQVSSHVVIPSTATGNTGAAAGLVSLVPGGESFGFTTLSSGVSSAQSTTAACTPSATCVYKLTNCGINASTAIGILEVTGVSVGGSFTVTSINPATAATQTNDNSKVCWQIN